MRARAFFFFQPECYIVDEWERDRDRCHVGKEIGQGEFGVVYDGKYDDPDRGTIPCAVKTMKHQYENDINSCQNFLNEAQVMK